MSYFRAGLRDQQPFYPYLHSIGSLAFVLLFYILHTQRAVGDNVNLWILDCMCKVFFLSN